MPFPSLDELKPSSEDLQLIHKLEEKVLQAGYDLLKKVSDISDKDNIDLQIATSESLTAGLIMSSLVNLPIGGWAKYGCFGVYDTDAKRVFNSVEVDDVYTHTCAKEMAIGILKNSNATFAISVTGNAMPYFIDLNKLGEVFIGVAGYFTKEVNGEKTTEIIYETRSINNCLNTYLDSNITEINKKCRSWISSQPNSMTYAKRSETAAISRIIRNYTATLAMRFALDFLNQHSLTVPDFIKKSKDKNKKKQDKKHIDIPTSKYERILTEICLNKSEECDKFTSEFGERWGSNEININQTTDQVFSTKAEEKVSQSIKANPQDIRGNVKSQFTEEKVGTAGGGETRRKKNKKRKIHKTKKNTKKTKKTKKNKSNLKKK